MSTHSHTQRTMFPSTFRYRPFGIMAPLYDGAADAGAGGQGGGNGGGAGGDKGAGGGGEGDKGGQPKMIQISEDEFEQRIVGRIKQAETTWKKANTVSTLTAEERVELETSRREREEAKRKELESKGQYEAALKSHEDSIRKPYEEEKKKLGETVGGLTKRLREEIVTNKLTAAAADGNAYNAKQVVKLTEPFVRLDEEFNATVVDESGTPRFVAGQPMTVGQLVEEFLKGNPHLVKAQAGGGGGAGGGAHAKGETPTEIAQAEAEVLAAENEWKQSRSTVALTKHTKAVARLNELKRKGGKAA